MEKIYAAFGKFSIRAMIKGEIIPIQPPRYKICMTEIAIFIYDVFNFEGNSPPGCWNCEDLEFKGLDSQNGLFITNSDLRFFREQYGKGNDFMIFSKPILIEDFVRCCHDTTI